MVSELPMLVFSWATALQFVWRGSRGSEVAVILLIYYLLTADNQLTGTVNCLQVNAKQESN